jgi:hypothetical protein
MHLTTLLRCSICLLAIQLTSVAKAQDPLPAFEVRDIGSGRIVISWYNNYPKTAQLTIQRSFDSLRGYKSILTVPDPSAVQNGFADTKAVNDHMFYRLYILLDKGNYFFTTPKRPVKQTAATMGAPPVESITNNAAYATTTTSAAGTIPKNQHPSSSARRDNAAPTTTDAAGVSLTAPDLTEALTKDSATGSLTRQQFSVKKVAPVVIRLDPSRMGDSAKVPFSVSPQNDPDAYAPSLYVYAQPDGNIRIDVPNKKRYAGYRIRFYEADKQLLFELKQLPAPSFQLDKTNFLHSGWFLFELYEESRLVERHKIFLEKDF